MEATKETISNAVDTAKFAADDVVRAAKGQPSVTGYKAAEAKEAIMGGESTTKPEPTGKIDELGMKCDVKGRSAKGKVHDKASSVKEKIKGHDHHHAHSAKEKIHGKGSSAKDHIKSGAHKVSDKVQK